jgi:ketosteroid isomerase-like protein
MAVRERAGEVVTKAKRRVGIENPSAADADGNVGTVRGALRAFGQGDFDEFLDALNDDVTWEAPGGNFPGGSELDGCETIKDKFVADIGRTFTEFGFIPENFVDTDDDAVIVIGTFKGEGARGDAVETAGVQIWQFGSGTEAELIRIYTDGAAFPEVITEEKLREEEEEEKKKEEEEKKKAEGDADADAEAEDEGSDEDDDSDDEPKSETKDDTKSETKDDTKSETKDDTESESKDEESDDSDDEPRAEKKDDSDSDSDDSSEKKDDDEG